MPKRQPPLFQNLAYAGGTRTGQPPKKTSRKHNTLASHSVSLATGNLRQEAGTQRKSMHPLEKKDNTERTHTIIKESILIV